jgi:6-phosphogluconolactonase
MRIWCRTAMAFIAACMATLAVVPAAVARGDQGFVYAATNSPVGNSLLVFYRAGDGGLTPAGSFSTGGDGTGAGLGSGHSVIASRDGRTVLVVNAGSNTVSAFGWSSHGLRLIGPPAPSGGTTPTSVTIHGSLVYVMNAGSGSISGFTLDRHLGLKPIPGSTQSLAASGTGTDSQIQFDRSGRVLIVDERAPVNLIQTFVVRGGGTIAPGATVPADGGAPFGFDVDGQGHVLFSNAALGGGLMSGASSYDVGSDGTLTPNGAPVSSGQAAACWLAVVGRYAFTTNAASGSIGTFAIAQDGTLSHVGTTPIAPTALPLDEAGVDGHFLYVLAGGLDEIIGYDVADDGTLTQIAAVPVPGGTLGVGAD